MSLLSNPLLAAVGYNVVFPQDKSTQASGAGPIQTKTSGLLFGESACLSHLEIIFWHSHETFLAAALGIPGDLRVK